MTFIGSKFDDDYSGGSDNADDNYYSLSFYLMGIT